jgi:hypothetical protein
MNSPSKTIATTLLVVAILIWIMLAIAGTNIIVYRGPYLFYSVRSPSPKEECAQIRPGMNLQQVLAITSKHTDPYDEGFSGQEIYFSRTGATCHVEMDPTTLRVKRTYVREDIPIQ